MTSTNNPTKVTAVKVLAIVMVILGVWLIIRDTISKPLDFFAGAILAFFGFYFLIAKITITDNPGVGDTGTQLATSTSTDTGIDTSTSTSI